MTTSKYSLSAVVPFYNEEDVVVELYTRLRDVLSASGHPFEMVFVNDGSSDRTGQELAKIQSSDDHVKLVELMGNRGQTMALAAGFANASGDVVVPMDGDLQHLPEEIPLFLEKIDEGYDIVSGWRQSRKESLILRRIPSIMANRLMAALSGVQIHDFGTTFKAYRKEVLSCVQLYGDFHRFIPALAKPLNASITEVPIAAPARETGKSSYGIMRTFTVFFDILRIKFLVTFVSRPLQFFGTGGFLLVIAGGGLGLVLLTEKLVHHIEIMSERGPLFITTIFLLLAGMQLLSIGFLGEMITRMSHDGGQQVKNAIRRVRGRGLEDGEK
jgi:glycosyltransferase involved in cell wall biosynthesis